MNAFLPCICVSTIYLFLLGPELVFCAGTRIKSWGAVDSNLTQNSSDISQICLKVTDQSIECFFENLSSDPYLLNVNEISPAESAGATHCLNSGILSRNTCTERYAGKSCISEENCLKLKRYASGGVIRCGVANRTINVEYFTDIHVRIRTDMKEIWNPANVILIEVEDDENERYVLINSNESESASYFALPEKSSAPCLAAIKSYPPSPQPKIIVYNNWTARFECQSLEHALAPPASWFLNLTNGGQVKIFPEIEAITREMKYKMVSRDGRADLPVMSSHIQFQVWKDIESITCRMSYRNSSKFASNTRYLRILEGQRPAFEKTTDFHNVTEGDDLFLRYSEASSDPPAVYTWTHNGKPFVDYKIWNNCDQHRGRHLQAVFISAVRKENAGTYTLTATNFRGSATMAFYVLVTPRLGMLQAGPRPKQSSRPELLREASSSEICIQIYGRSAECYSGNSSNPIGIMAMVTKRYNGVSPDTYGGMESSIKIGKCRSHGFRDFDCFKMDSIPRNGILACSMDEKDKGFAVAYYQDVYTRIHTKLIEGSKLSQLWKVDKSDYAIKVEKENNALELELKGEHHSYLNVNGSRTVVESSSCGSDEPQWAPQTESYLVVFTNKMTGFECHSLDFFLTGPVSWSLGWINGTISSIHVHAKENVTEETRYNKVPELETNGGIVRVEVRSSHMQLQVLPGMLNISCKRRYWESEDWAEDVQKVTQQAGTRPRFKTSMVDHKESKKVLQLKCQETEGLPEPDYFWEWNGKAVSENFTKSMLDVENGRHYSLLQIQGATGSQNGEYTCIARNFLGESKMVFRVSIDIVDRNPWNPWLVSGAVIIAVLIAVIAWLYRKNLNQKSKLSSLEIKEFKKGTKGEVTEQDYANNIVKHMPYDENYEIPWRTLKLTEKVLGKGVHGVVYKGTLGALPVAVKTIRPGVEKAVLKALLDELKIMIHLGKHDYIVDLKGACTGYLSEGRAYVVVEFCNMGSLESFLRTNEKGFCIQDGDYVNSLPQNNANGHGLVPFTRQNMILWSIQIASAMGYLESKKVIHGDLAVRNVLMKSIDHIKITDFGLSRQLINTETYVKTKQELLPWRYMAIEALKTFTFSSQSDVWSYGVTVWEIFTLGSVPYPGMGWSADFVKYLEENLRLSKPRFSTDAINRILEKCWEPEPKDRPSFKDLEAAFSGLMEYL